MTTITGFLCHSKSHHEGEETVSFTHTFSGNCFGLTGTKKQLDRFKVGERYDLQFDTGNLRHHPQERAQDQIQPNDLQGPDYLGGSLGRSALHTVPVTMDETTYHRLRQYAEVLGEPVSAAILRLVYEGFDRHSATILPDRSRYQGHEAGD